MQIGIDLGGTKIEGIVLAPDGRERARQRIDTPTSGYEAVLNALTNFVNGLEAVASARCTVGVGTPGFLSPATGLIRNSNLLPLNGRAVDRDLAARLDRPVRIANDANCFALSEASDGAGRDGEVVFGVILGTGVGSGIVVRGGVLSGPNAIAGEWGHNPLPWPEDNERPGPPCFCGQHGCIETFLSGPGMERDHLVATGHRLPAAEIARRAANGDADAGATLLRYERRLAKALAHVINIVDPDVIVLGGGMSNIDRLYVDIPALWGKWVFSDRVDTRLVRHVHGDSSGVRGAAWLWNVRPRDHILE